MSIKTEMESDNTESEETSVVTSIKSKNNVLSIGDDEDLITDKSEENKNSFHDAVRKHLCVLITGIKTPSKTIDIGSPVNCFGAARIMKNNKPSQYRFYCLKDKDWRSHMIISGLTYNAKEAFKYVQNRLKEENWISDDTIVTPLKTKDSPGLYHESDLYIQNIVAEALDAERERLLKFILYLHRNYR